MIQRYFQGILPEAVESVDDIFEKVIGPDYLSPLSKVKKNSEFEKGYPSGSVNGYFMLSGSSGKSNGKPGSHRGADTGAAH